jgi:hypothetical protein
MTPHRRLLIPEAHPTANHQLEVLQRERIADRAAATDPSDLEPCETDINRALVEQAKGALMLHYGVDSHRAFAVLLGWARTSSAPVTTIAHTLLRGICEGNPQTEVRQRALMRWLEAQLRAGDPGHAQPRTAPPRGGPAQESPRSG